MSADEAPPPPWQSCICGHLALQHEADEHGVREGCTVTVAAAEDGATDLQCPCQHFERKRRSQDISGLPANALEQLRQMPAWQPGVDPR